MNEIDIIKGARSILSDPDMWTKGRWCIRDKVCIEGALGVAYGRDACALVKPDCAPAPLRRAAELVLKHAPKPPDGHQPWKWLSVFNDHESTTHQDVLNVLDKTLADLGGLV